MNNRINTNNPTNPLKFEVRRLQQQADGRSLSVVIPTKYIRKLELSKGDLLKMHLSQDDKLLMSKVNLQDNYSPASPGGTI